VTLPLFKTISLHNLNCSFKYQYLCTIYQGRLSVPDDPTSPLAPDGPARSNPARVRASDFASSVTRELFCAGFDVIEGIDLSRDEMVQRLLEFGDKAKGADIAVFYNSGQGISVDGSEFLLATDADIKSRIMSSRATRSTRTWRSTMSEAKTKLVFLDASRSNPFPALRKRNRDAFRSERALEMKAPTTRSSYLRRHGRGRARWPARLHFDRSRAP
jgi:hypothetical protein